MFLAENGFHVSAFDISAQAIRKLKYRAAAKKLEMHAFEADMRNYSFNRVFDVVIAHGSLMLVERRFWQRVIREMKHWTAPGGFNVLAVITDSAPTPENLRPFCLGIFHEGELRSLYEDWDLQFWQTKTKMDTNLPETRLIPLNKLIARKPSH